MAQVLLPSQISQIPDAAAVYPSEHLVDLTIASNIANELKRPKRPKVEQTRPVDTVAAVPPMNLYGSHLISSPYAEVANQLNLDELDTSSKLFAFALTALRPIREDYAIMPYLESFNWDEVFALLRSLCRDAGFDWKQLDFYVVIFRSRLQENIDRERLGLLDQKSHAEACSSGGLLKYWFGQCDQERRNLATCVWRNREDAIVGGSGPWHRQARAAARVMYEKIDFHVHKLTIADAAKTWTLEKHT